MACRKKVFGALLILQIVAFIHAKDLRLRVKKDARLPGIDDESMHPEEVREVRILPKSFVTHIPDSPTRLDKSEEEDDEEIIERDFLDQMAKIPLEALQTEESIESAQINGIPNVPFDVDREIFSDSPRRIPPPPPPRRPIPDRTTVRPPVPPDGRLPNGLYTDIGRVIPINEYMQSRRIPPRGQPVPPVNPTVRFENDRLPYSVPVRPVEPIYEEELPKEEESDLLKGLLERIRPGGRRLHGNRRRWALYFGHVFLQALNTLIDGTQVALKGGAIN